MTRRSLHCFDDIALLADHNIPLVEETAATLAFSC